jgi:glycosyltransferase involved in cell wall biosynthesis
LRIGINTLAVIPSEIGGTQTYLRKLIENLARIDEESEYFLFVTPWNQKLFQVKKRNFRQIICNLPLKTLPLRTLYEQTVLPVLVWKNKIDIFHSAASVSPFLLFCPLVLTLHDVIPFIFPKLTPLIFRLYWGITYRISARLAHFIITDSYSAQKDIGKYLGISKEKLKVVYLANSQQKLEVKDKRQLIFVQNNKRGNHPYILWVGKMFTHKNLDRLLRAYSKLIKIKHINHQLIICGMRGWGYPTFARRVEELNLQERVTFKGYVPNDVLRSIYAKASLFVFPSLVEGFGLPILEAMSYRVPVITSNYGAMAEVAGDAALLVDPYNIDEIAEAMYRVLTDENLREDLIKKGFERASQFSWERTARETLSVYKRVYEQKYH